MSTTPQEPSGRPAPGSLTGLSPQLAGDRLIADLVPPPRFAEVRFETYRPDPAQPSQAQAVAATRRAAQAAGSARGTAGPGWRRWFGAAATPAPGRGTYLDGGFGVGKTHLLASMWHEVATGRPGAAAYGTFGEYTHLVGALGFAPAVAALSDFSLVCLDEFELDDPGDTVLMSTLLRQLVDAGVHLAATSNTVPGSLGEGRFAAQDFQREIQGLSSRFDAVRIDGEDYRHRGLPTPPDPLPDDRVAAALAGVPGAVVDDLPALLDHLSQLHPSRYGALLDGVSAVGWTGVRTVADQSVLLRLVVLADRLYDRDLPLVVGGSGLADLIDAEAMRGGYQKKYARALSRLTALARDGHDRFGDREALR